MGFKKYVCTISWQRLPHAADLLLPGYALDGDGAIDLRAAVPFEIVIEPGTHAVIPTGFAAALLPGTVGLICPRSGLAAVFGIGIVNAPGVIDPNYRGEIKVILHNGGADPFMVRRGDRIAQLMLVPRIELRATEVAELPTANRGDAGFGSTGAC